MYRGKFELFILSDKLASLAFPVVAYLLAMVLDVLLPDQARFSNVPVYPFYGIGMNNKSLDQPSPAQRSLQSIWKKKLSWSPFKLSSMSSQVDGWRANSVSNQEVFAAAKPCALPLWRCKELSKVMMVLKNTYVRNWWLKILRLHILQVSIQKSYFKSNAD